MRKASRRPVVIVLLALVASLLGVIAPSVANAAESIPDLQWPAVASGNSPTIIGGPSGSVTMGCLNDSNVDSYNNDLQTIDASGQVIRDIPRTHNIDGVPNCIGQPAVDKNGDVYGFPSGEVSGSWETGPNLLAYSGNTLKWKIAASCGSSGYPPVVGADGNIYTLTLASNGDTHLMGLTPEVAPGTTKPSKVLNIKVPGDCGTQLFAYKDGIMLHGNSTSGDIFYSYTGKKVSTFPDSLGDDQKINDHGRLFTWSTVTGSYHSFSVSVYDPNQDKVMWTTSASTPGADTKGGPSLFPMKDGGVAALMTEQKMVGGVPASPTEWVKGLSVINASGVVTRSFQFPTAYSNGGVTGTYDSSWSIIPDNTGKLVVIRGLYLDTDVSYPASVPAIDIGVYDPVTNTWPYHQVMSGDLAKSGGPNGYLWNYSAVSTDIADSTVFLTAGCRYNCDDSDIRLYAIDVSSVGTAYPRMDVTNTSPRPSAAYVALGDSFSSGEGNPPFEDGTDIANVNTCHRSEDAYPELIAGTGSIPSLSTGTFRACSGAVSKNIWNNPEWNEGIQLDWWPDTTTQVVTMTIGGNDIGFSDFAKACVTSTCAVGSDAYNTSLNKINNNLPSALTTTYQEIMEEFPNAQVYVMDYPQVIADKETSDPDDPRCPYMYNNTGDTGAEHYPWEDAWGAHDIVDKLDAAISTAIGSVKNISPDYDSRLQYVPTNGANSLFEGHRICDSGTSYFQNLDQIAHNEAYVFHPNADGQQAYADIMSAAINAG